MPKLKERHEPKKKKKHNLKGASESRPGRINHVWLARTDKTEINSQTHGRIFCAAPGDSVERRSRRLHLITLKPSLFAEQLAVHPTKYEIPKPWERYLPPFKRPYHQVWACSTSNLLPCSDQHTTGYTSVMRVMHTQFSKLFDMACSNPLHVVSTRSRGRCTSPLEPFSSGKRATTTWV